MFFSKLDHAKFTQKQGENNGNYLIPYHIKSFLIGLASIFEVFNFFFSSGSMIGNINSKVLFPQVLRLPMDPHFLSKLFPFLKYGGKLIHLFISQNLV